MMNGMRRFFSALLCVILAAVCLAASAESEAGAGSIFDDVTFTETAVDGFLIPTPEGSGWTRIATDNDNPNQILAFAGPTSKDRAEMYIYIYDSESPFQYAEDPATAEAEIRDDFAKVGKSASCWWPEEEFIDVDGHPAGLMTYILGGAYSCGRIAYARNTRYLMFVCYNDNVAGEKSLSLEDMKGLARRIGYDETQAPFTAAKATFSVIGKGGTDSAVAGKPLQMEAVFDDQEAVNRKKKNDTVNWTVVNAATGAEDPAATITAKGQLKVDGKLEAPMELEVRGRSAVYGTEASCRISATPVIKGVTVEPAELFFYVGNDEPLTVKASLVPDTVPPAGITWTPAKEGTVEITPVTDGEAAVRPLAVGKVAVTVKEPSGRSVKLNVSVVPPVESVELAVKGKAKAGGTVAVSAVLTPKDAGNKAVEWSLDVGEDIATITDKGQVKISREAPSGTKITVTCKALGAPEPVAASVEIEIP